MQCRQCGEHMNEKKRTRTYCSVRCALIHRNSNDNPSKYIKTGRNHHSWKGNKAGYYSIHVWVRSRYGKADGYKCAFCGTDSTKDRMVWMNLSGKYHRLKSDWKPSCQSCNLSYDWRRKKNNPEYVNEKLESSMHNAVGKQKQPLSLAKYEKLFVETLRKNPKATIHDFAKAAGRNRSTVFRVMRKMGGSGGMSSYLQSLVK